MPARVTLVEQADPTQRVVLPVTPRELPDSLQAAVRQYAIVGAGQHSQPNGRDERHFTLTGTLPGPGRVGLPHVQAQFWQLPRLVVRQVEDWLFRGARLRYTAEGQFGVQECTVYVSKRTFTAVGAYGDVSYDLELTEWRTLRLRVDDGSSDSDQTAAGSTGGEEAGDGEDAGGDPPTPASYTVQAGDTLIQVAKATLGDSGRWQEIFDLNQGQDMGDGRTLTDPDLIYPGWTLQIPGGTAPPTDDES